MALSILPFSNLTGGTDTSYLDYWDGNDLSDGQMAFGIVNGTHYAYLLDASSGASENSPYVISPDTNAGTKRWVLQSPVNCISGLTVLRKTATQSVSANIWTSLTWSVADYDNLSAWSSGSTITVPTGIAWMRISSAYVNFASNDGEFRGLNFQRSSGTGTQYACQDIRSGKYEGSMVISSSWVAVVAGDTYTLQTISASAISLGYSAGWGGSSNITIEWIDDLQSLHRTV